MKVYDPGLSVCHYSICAIVSLLAAMSDERDMLWYTDAMLVLLSGFVVLRLECA